MCGLLALPTRRRETVEVERHMCTVGEEDKNAQESSEQD